MKLSAAEAATLDRIRGSMKRGAYLRHLLVSSDTRYPIVEAREPEPEKPWSDWPVDPEPEQPVAPTSNEPTARPASTPRRIVAARPSQPGGQVTTGCRHPGRMRFGSIGNRTCRICGTKGLP